MIRTLLALVLATQFQLSRGLSFEVASIKPSSANSPPLSISSSPGRFNTSNTSLNFLVTWAFDLEGDDRLIGAPSWLESIRYDITATAPGPSDYPVREPLKVMMQSLLKERFKLVYHREKREIPVYALTKDTKGFKIVLRAPGDDTGKSAFNMPWAGRLVGTKVNSAMLAKVLSEQLRRTVEDRTGLDGIFDFMLEWAPDSNVAEVSGRPSIFTALREQLGLQLEAHKSPVEVLVIDRIERFPTEN